jgi:hypothetical protein
VDLRLEPLPKLLDEVLGSYHPAAIAFKLADMATEIEASRI